MKHHAVPELEVSDDICVMSFACEGQRVPACCACAQGYVEVCDDVGSETSHVVTWQLAPGWRIEQERKNGFVCHHAESIPVHATLNGDDIEAWEIGGT
jgi:hypothetical protein